MLRSGFFIILLLWLFHDSLCSQDEMDRMDNIINPWVLNPARTGQNDNTFDVFAGRQWAGFKGAPAAFGFHINGRLAPFDFYTNRMLVNTTKYKSRGKVGLGASLLNDINGPFTYSELKVNYAYHIEFNGSRLSFGLVTDFEFSGVKESRMDPLVDNDPRITGVNRSKILFNPGFGVAYNNDHLDLGLACNNLLQNGALIRNDDILYFENRRLYSLSGSYSVPAQLFILIPAITLGTRDFDDFSYDLSGRLIYKEDYKIYLTYRSLKMIMIHVGMDLRRLYFMYGFSTPLSSLNRYIYGSHEITVGLKFGLYVY